MINSLSIQLCYVLLIALLVLVNRLAWADPKLPLLGLGIVLGVWLLSSVYVLACYGWSLYQGLGFANVIQAVAVALSIIPFVLVGFGFIQSRQVPAIHDITTDTLVPPLFAYAKERRHRSHNSVVYDQNNSVLQQQTYPHIQPLRLSSSPSVVIEAVQQVMTNKGWQLHGVDRVAGTVEAYDVTPLMGFVDDIIVRVRQHEEGSWVDIRSASRIGRSDFGANAARIDEFSKALVLLLPNDG